MVFKHISSFYLLEISTLSKQKFTGNFLIFYNPRSKMTQVLALNT